MSVLHGQADLFAGNRMHSFPDPDVGSHYRARQCPDREIQRIEFRVNQHTNYLNLVS